MIRRSFLGVRTILMQFILFAWFKKNNLHQVEYQAKLKLRFVNIIWNNTR
jgi:hypothetical protein